MQTFEERPVTPSGQRRLPRSRHEFLVREVNLRGSVRASDIAERLGVTEVTVRRDIVELERQNLLVRVHGGAIAVSHAKSVQPAKALVGVVIPDSAALFRHVIHGMEAAAQGVGARVILSVSSYHPEIERRHVKRLLELGVDGLVLTPTLRGQTEDDIACLLDGLSVPVVFLERRLDEDMRLAVFDSVRTDHVRGAVLAVQHFASAGHRRVALAVYDRTPTAPHVHEGYQKALARFELAPAPVASLPKGEEDQEALGEAIEQFLDDCLTTGTRAALVHTDFHASRLIEAALDRGLRVPHDLAVIAYDDNTAEMGIVPLSAVAAPTREIGETALRMIVERIREQQPGPPPRQIQLLPRLIVRKSCGVASTE
jgi:DNA-binding LacI/PurR family transcriptional regulator